MNSRYDSIDLPEARVAPALLGTIWVSLSGLPAGTRVKARLGRSQMAVGTLRAEGALTALDVDHRWWSTSDPWDDSFAHHSMSPGWLSPDSQVAS